MRPDERRARAKRKKLKLVVTSNLPEFVELLPGELELILPSVTSAVESMHDDPAQRVEAKATTRSDARPASTIPETGATSGATRGSERDTK